MIDGEMVVLLCVGLLIGVLMLRIMEGGWNRGQETAG